MAAGLRTVHEWTPHNVIDPEVVADTSLIWSWKNFLRTLKRDDVVICLERPIEEVEVSVSRLLGHHDWSHLFRQWKEFNEALDAAQLRHFARIQYTELFSDWGCDRVADLLREAYPDFVRLGYARLQEIWSFMRNMKVTNRTAERMVKESHGF